MDIRFFQKKYEMRTNGSLFLSNPEPVLQYIGIMVEKLMRAKSSEEERDVKLAILQDFRKIYEYDLEHADMPEPFGHFENQKEKDEFIKRKMLNQNFGLYLSNIFMSFHEQKYKKSKRLPILRCPRMVIDYNELYDRALCEYVGTLIGAEYPVRIKVDEEIVYEPARALKQDEKEETAVVWKKIEWRGTVMPLPVPVDPRIPQQQMARHAVGTSYVLPSLIEHFLGMYLQNRMLFSGIRQLIPMIKKNKITMNDEERRIIGVFTGEKHEQVIFYGTQEYVMGKVYGVLIRAKILKDTQDNERILTGVSRQKRRMLGVMLHSDYAKKQIRPEYMGLLTDMFDTSRMNIRNSMMHGSSETFDYLSLGVASVMLQLLWDIASEDIFICTREELLRGQTEKETGL